MIKQTLRDSPVFRRMVPVNQDPRLPSYWTMKEGTKEKLLSEWKKTNSSLSKEPEKRLLKPVTTSIKRQAVIFKREGLKVKSVKPNKAVTIKTEGTLQSQTNTDRDIVEAAVRSITEDQEAIVPQASSNHQTKSYSLEKNMLGETLYKCNMAGCEFSHKKFLSIQDHINCEHAQVELRCYLCPRAFYKLKALQNHIYEQHKAKALECNEPGCKFKALVAQHFEKHFRERHPGRTMPDHLKPFDPSVPSVLVNHSKAEMGKWNRKSYSQESVDTKVQMEEILQWANLKADDKGKNFISECKLCSKTFKTAKKFKEHYQFTHMGIKFKGDVCDKHFAHPSNVATHKKKMHGVKSGPQARTKKNTKCSCPVPGCPFKSSTSVMQKHLTGKHGAVYVEEHNSFVWK